MKNTLLSSRNPAKFRAAAGAAALCLALLPQVSLAQIRRAFLVGIDKYRPATAAEEKNGAAKLAAAGEKFGPGTRGDYVWQSLDGSVNDVQAMRDLLIHRFNFLPQNISVLENEAATRKAILDGMRKHFIDEARDGDVLFFFYAGHGSQMRNSLSYKEDKEDETIVPWDANMGVWDIRDKEIARMFNAALDHHKDKPVTLTAIFDSCHSGSIARGLGVKKLRYLPGDTRDARDDYHPTPPEERGALIISAAQYNEPAVEDDEDVGGKKIPHGAFTLALLRTLNHVPPNTPVRDVFRITRTTLHASGAGQEPVLAGINERLKQALFGDLAGTSAKTLLYVQGIDADGRIMLDGGYSLGLQPKAELRKAGTKENSGVRLRISAVRGLSSSVAEPVDRRTLPEIKKLDAFEVDRWAFPDEAKLTVWLGSTNLPLSQVNTAAAEFGKLRSLGIQWITDPSDQAPTHIVRWNGKTWEIKSRAGMTALGVLPSAEAVKAALAQEPDARVFVYLPVAADVRAKLALGAGSENDAIALADRPEAAKYWLVGRTAEAGVEYAWVLATVTAENGLGDSPLVPRSDWLAPGASEVGDTAEKLMEHIQGIERVAAWVNLASPPDEGDFPYQLALRNRADGSWITGSEFQPFNGGVTDRSARIITPRTHEDEHYELVLRADPEKLKGIVEPRKVYVFAIDSYGRCQRAFPKAAADDQTNLLPLRDADGKYPPELTVASFRVRSPFGVDSYFMLTTDQPIGDLTVFECNSVRTRGSRGNNPLADLLRQTAQTTRGNGFETPEGWSIQRLSVRSVALEKEIKK